MPGFSRPWECRVGCFWANGIARPESTFLEAETEGDETVDRIRTVSDGRFRYLRNFYPDRPFLQTNRYKEYSYPIISLMRELDEAGKLTPDQARLLASDRPPEELYDLEADPYELHNLAEDPVYRDVMDRLRAVLDAWMLEVNDQGTHPGRPGHSSILGRKNAGIL